MMCYECAKVGVISDTHGMLRAEALQALQGVELILHAGDAGDPFVLTMLESIAPVLAVRGNVDHGPWADSLPLQRYVKVQSTRIFMTHILEDYSPTPGRMVHLIITGHTHRPKIERVGEVLYLNPGSAGPRRFSLPATLALLDIDGTTCQTRLLNLEAPGGPDQVPF